MRFDPFGWASKVIPVAMLHRVIRYSAAVLCAGFLVHRLLEYSLYRNHWLWAMETAVYTIVIVAYILRTDPKDRSIGLQEVVIPVIATLLPFTLLFTSVHAQVWQQLWLLDSIFWVMTAGTGLAVLGLWYLRRSFSITVEARNVVSNGPYRFIRHPVYLGEIVATLAIAALRFSWVNLSLVLIFIVLQLWRTWMEEQKLSASFPQYHEFAQTALWLWPVKRPAKWK